jgi:DNA-binding beta-propeller fold protein YncE
MPALPVSLPTSIYPMVWIDPADITSYTTDATVATKLSAITNKGRGGASMTVSGSNISVGQDNINNRPTFVFSATSAITTQQILTTNGPSIEDGTFAVFFVAKVGTFLGSINPFCGPTTALYGTMTATMTATSLSYGANSTSSIAATINTVDNPIQIYCCVGDHNGVENNNYITVNGIPQTLTKSFTNSIGARGTLQTYTMAGSGVTYAELLVYTTRGGIITMTQRIQIEGYLAWKWGLQANLPATHPYSTLYMASTLALYTHPRMFVTTFVSGAFINPRGIVKDLSGNFYVAESNTHAIRKITPAGVVSVLAGSGQWMSSPGTTDGIGTAARFNTPSGIAIDSTNTNLYVADYGNHRIRRIVIATGQVTTLAGPNDTILTSGSTDGTGTTALFFSPNGVVVHPTTGNMYVADRDGNKIRMVTTGGAVTTPYGPVAGTTTLGWADGVGNAASFTFPASIAIDATGSNLYVGESSKVRKINISTGYVSTLAGPTTSNNTGDVDGVGTDARTYRSDGIACDEANNVYTCNYVVNYVAYNKIRKITPAGVASVFAGPGQDTVTSRGTVTSGRTDGLDDMAHFNNPTGIVISGSDFYVSEYLNNTIRKISKGALNQVGTFATALSGPASFAINKNGEMILCNASAHIIKKITSTGVQTVFAGSGTAGYGNGTGGAATFGAPKGIAIDSVGNLYVTDATYHNIRKITPAGVVTTFAGSASGVPENGNGNGTSATFNTPWAIAIDTNDNLFVCDNVNNSIRKITPQAVVSTFATITSPRGIAIDASNNLYVTSGSHRVYKIASTGTVTTIAGSGTAGNGNGNGTSATFNTPTGIVVDSKGIIYVRDGGSQLIRRITTANDVTTIAGSSAGAVDGVGTAAAFTAGDSFMYLDTAANLWVGDTGNNSIRVVTLTDGAFDTSTATIPGNPTNLSVVTGNTMATLAFSPPSSNGGSAITQYTATSGVLVFTSPQSPVICTGLTNGSSYTFTVSALNGTGTSINNLSITFTPPATISNVAFVVTGPLTLTLTAPMTITLT